MTYETMIQPALWFVSIGACAVFLVRALWARHKSSPGVKRLLLIAAGAATSAAFIVPAIGVIPPGQRGVVYNADGGVSLAERGEGFTLLIPWVQHMRTLSVRTQKVYSSKIYSQSRDLQEITVVASVNFHVQPNKAAELFRGVGNLYKTTVIQPALYQRMKAAVGQVLAVDFASKRDELAKTVENQLTTQLGKYGIVIEYVNIEDAIFDPQFVRAVKDKVIAVQKAAEQRRLIQAEAAIKQQTIIQAEARARSVKIEATAQAKANRLLARSLTEPLLRWRWINTWNGSLPTTLVGSDGKVTFLLNGSTGGNTGGY